MLAWAHQDRSTQLRLCQRDARARQQLDQQERLVHPETQPVLRYRAATNSNARSRSSRRPCRDLRLERDQLSAIRRPGQRVMIRQQAPADRRTRAAAHQPGTQPAHGPQRRGERAATIPPSSGSWRRASVIAAQQLLAASPREPLSEVVSPRSTVNELCAAADRKPDPQTGPSNAPSFGARVVVSASHVTG